MPNDLPYLSELKTRAKILRASKVMSHSKALELIAREYGFRDWNTLVAAAGPQPPARVGQIIEGHYLNIPFKGKVLWIKAHGPNLFRINIHFDKLIDVVTFDSFSSWKNRANTVVDMKGVSIDKTSDGQPHMVLSI